MTTRTWMFGCVLLGATLTACASSTPEASAPAGATSTDAPCGPSDCAPCDPLKGKCMGPSVCDGHPEKARRVCARNDAGACVSTLVCE